MRQNIKRCWLLCGRRNSNSKSEAMSYEMKVE